MVSMLLTQSVFLGIFIGAFDIAAHSLLLSAFDEKMLARSYIVSGLAGIILITIYSNFRSRIQFREFAIICFSVISALTLSLWCALIFSPAKWIIIIVFIMLGPLNLLTLLGFWETTEKLFADRHLNKAFQFADAGLIFGILIISFCVPLLMSLNLQAHNILLISVSSVIIVTIIQTLIGSGSNMAGSEKDQYYEKTQMRTHLSAFREDSFIRTIGIFAVLSVLAAFFIQYSFMAVTRLQYPVAEDMAGFLGLFIGWMMIFILVVKLVIFPYLFRNYGLFTCLVIAPGLIVLFTSATIVTGLLMGSETVSAGGFLILFLLLAFSRIISKSLRDSVEFPSLKIIFQSISKKKRSELQAGITGKVNEMSVVLSGLLLTVLGLFGFIKLIHFSFALFIISLLWLAFAIKLFKAYRNLIIKKANTAGLKESLTAVAAKQVNFKNRFSAYLDFRSDYFSLISGDYSGLNKRRNKWYYEKIIDHAYSKKDLSLMPVLKKTANNTDLDEIIRQHSTEILEILQKDSTSPNSDNEKNSGAIKLLSGTRMPQTTEILRLLRNHSVDSKRLAINMIGKFRLKDLLMAVCECLIIPPLTRDAYEVLRSFGSDADDELVRYYLITSGNIKLSKIIIQLLGKTRSKVSTGFLFSLLWSNSRQLKEMAIKYLIDCKFQASEEEKQRLHLLTSEIIGNIAWHLAAKVSLEKDKDSFLLGKINHEILRWNTFLFNILSITYNPGAIAMIKENIERGTFESVNYALDMTDALISESVKPKLISLLDYVPGQEKLSSLFQFFPGEIPHRKKLLEDIINNDYNLISLWTKACTLRSITRIECDDMAESVTALLFSPEEIIQEEVVNLIARTKPDLYSEASPRIPDPIRSRMDKILNGAIDNKELLFEKVKFLANYFVEISEDDLLSLAYDMHYLRNFEMESLTYSEGIIIWPISADNHDRDVHIVYPGELSRFSGRHQDAIHQFSFYVLPLTAVEDYHFQFPDMASEILKYIDVNEGLL